MMNLLMAEFARIGARRITRFFPLGLMGVMVLIAGLGLLIALTADDATLDFVEDIGGGEDASFLLAIVAPVLPLMAFVIGASSIGADSKTGMLEQILTWEPRRLRFLAARLIAVMATNAVLALLVSLFYVGLMLAFTLTVGGSIDGISGEFVTNAAASLFRAALAAGIFAGIGLGLTTLIDSSIGAIVGFAIYWVVIELFGLLPILVPRIAAYRPIANFSAFITGQDVERLEESIISASSFESLNLVKAHGYLTAGIVLLLWLLAAMAPAAWRFAGRDID